MNMGQAYVKLRRAIFRSNAGIGLKTSMDKLAKLDNSYSRRLLQPGHHRARNDLGDRGAPHGVGPDGVVGGEPEREGEEADVRSSAWQGLGDS